MELILAGYGHRRLPQGMRTGSMGFKSRGEEHERRVTQLKQRFLDLYFTAFQVAAPLADCPL